MEKTAKSAAKRPLQKEKCKLRVQSTPEEIENFHRFMEKCADMGLCEVINFSDMFTNKGTSKYYRAYSDVYIKGEDDYEEGYRYCKF